MSSVPINRIFVVDADPVSAATIATILRMNGFSARFFTRSVEALEAARLDFPDLLISDVAMPELSGMDLAMLMSTSFPELKILLFSGQPNTSDILEVSRKRGYDFHLIPKPVHPTVLLSGVLALVPDQFSVGMYISKSCHVG